MVFYWRSCLLLFDGWLGGAVTNPHLIKLLNQPEVEAEPLKLRYLQQLMEEQENQILIQYFYWCIKLMRANYWIFIAVA